MASKECMELANYGPFQDRVRYFLKKAAIAIMAESDTVDEHEKRVAFSRRVLAEQVNKIAYTIGVSTNSTVAATVGTKTAEVACSDVSDGDLEFTVNSLINAYSE